MNVSRIPEKIPPSAHDIKLSAVSDSAVKVVVQLKKAGFEAYLVGGCVRDLLLQQRPKDFDIATDAHPEQVRELFRSCRLIGRRFRLAHVRVGRDVIEVATFRAAPAVSGEHDEDTARVSAEGQVVRDNVYGTMAEDAVRRDFTVNALYYDPQEQCVIDYVRGVDDLKAGQLLTIGDPWQRFREDPVRMLRAIRFAAKLDFEVHPDAMAAVRELVSLLHHVPPARMLDEVIKLFHSGHAEKTFTMLREAGLFRYLFPFTEQCLDEVGPSLPVLALANTDRRIGEGKPVIPGFLFSCLLWDPLRTDIEKLVDSGMEAREAFMTAVNDVIRDQNQYVSIPRRIGLVMREIWSLQARLERRQPRSIRSLLEHNRFRAAYDFLLLRCEVDELPRSLGEWWTQIQEADKTERERMIKQLAPPTRGGRRRRRRRAA